MEFPWEDWPGYGSAQNAAGLRATWWASELDRFLSGMAFCSGTYLGHPPVHLQSTWGSVQVLWPLQIPCMWSGSGSCGRQTAIGKGHGGLQARTCVPPPHSFSPGGKAVLGTAGRCAWSAASLRAADGAGRAQQALPGKALHLGTYLGHLLTSL